MVAILEYRTCPPAIAIIILFYFPNPLCILNNAYFDIVDISVEYDLVDKLNYCQCGYFGWYPCFEAFEGLGVVSPYHELVTQLREQRFYSFSRLSVDVGLLPVILLVATHRGIELDTPGLEQVELVFGGKIAAVTDRRAVLQLCLYILGIVYVMYGGRAYVDALENPAYRTGRMQFISVIVRGLQVHNPLCPVPRTLGRGIFCCGNFWIACRPPTAYCPL